MARLVVALAVVIALMLPTAAFAAPQQPHEHRKTVKHSRHARKAVSLPLSGPLTYHGVIDCALQEDLFITEFFEDTEFLFADLDLIGNTACAVFPAGATQQALTAINNVDTGGILALSNMTVCGPSPICGSNPGTLALGNTGNFDAEYLDIITAPPGLKFNGGSPACPLSVTGQSLECRLDIFFSLP